MQNNISLIKHVVGIGAVHLYISKATSDLGT